ncbi:hypothetical protein LCGC14_1675940 [marine sediment metagenome]|uniref:Exonuclease domain-containing protein n=2 Tax=root TaxID=1 RepID=A0A0F9HQ18_9ZZZZ
MSKVNWMTKAAAPAQTDLFGTSYEPTPSSRRPVDSTTRPSAATSHTSGPVWPDDATMLRHLEDSGNYRVLRRLVPRPVVGRDKLVTIARAKDQKLGLIVDAETTGLDHRADEIIELGMVLFSYDDDGIGEVIDVFSALREPVQPISPEITRITGITAEMVLGQSIDPDAVARFIQPADCVIAHNAKFDRPFCERLAPRFDAKPWGCSVAEVNWADLGFEGWKLTYLVGQCGLFHNGHRAIDDCHALLEVLAYEAQPGEDAFRALIASMKQRRCRVWAHNSPFETKNILKARGYRWSDGSDGRLKSWWIEVDEDAFEEECRFLREEIYSSETTMHFEWLTAIERYRSI